MIDVIIKNRIPMYGLIQAILILLKCFSLNQLLSRYITFKINVYIINFLNYFFIFFRELCIQNYIRYIRIRLIGYITIGINSNNNFTSSLQHFSFLIILQVIIMWLCNMSVYYIYIVYNISYKFLFIKIKYFFKH